MNANWFRTAKPITWQQESTTSTTWPSTSFARFWVKGSSRCASFPREWPSCSWRSTFGNGVPLRLRAWNFKLDERKPQIRNPKLQIERARSPIGASDFGSEVSVRQQARHLSQHAECEGRHSAALQRIERNRY